MTVLLILVPLALALGFVGLLGFLWRLTPDNMTTSTAPRHASCRRGHRGQEMSAQDYDELPMRPGELSCVCGPAAILKARSTCMTSGGLRRASASPCWRRRSCSRRCPRRAA